MTIPGTACGAYFQVCVDQSILLVGKNTIVVEAVVQQVPEITAAAVNWVFLVVFAIVHSTHHLCN